MSRPELIKSLKNYPLLNKKTINNYSRYFFECIRGALIEKKTVEIRSLGTFFVKEIKEKFSARNPRSGEIIYVPKKIKLDFRPSKKFKQYLNS